MRYHSAACLISTLRRLVGCASLLELDSLCIFLWSAKKAGYDVAPAFQLANPTDDPVTEPRIGHDGTE